MPFQARDASAILEAITRGWVARHRAAGRQADASPGTDPWCEFDALALELEGLELGAREAAHRVLLRSQVGTDLDQSAFDDGTARIPASRARRLATIVGPPATAAVIAGATLSAADGTRFAVIDPVSGEVLTETGVTDGSGELVVTVEALIDGAAPNALAIGAILTWSSAPTGFAALATLGAVEVSGEEAESDDALRERLLQRRRERPGGGNRSYWRETLLPVAGVAEVFIYRVMTALETAAGSGIYDYQPNRPGNITALPFAPAPTSYAEGGDGMVDLFSRIPSSTVVDRVRNYLRGTGTRTGSGTATGIELYPAHMTAEQFFVVPPRATELDVIVSAKPADGWRWTPSAATVNSTGTTTTVLALNATPSDWQVNDRIAIADWSGARTRGRYYLRRVTAISGANVTLDTALPAIPPDGTAIRPDAVNASGDSFWGAIRLQLLRGVFDLLGPGAAPTQSFRYPEDTPSTFPGALTRALLLKNLLNVESLADGSVDSPAASQPALVGQVYVLRSLRVDRMP